MLPAFRDLKLGTKLNLILVSILVKCDRHFWSDPIQNTRK